MSTSIDPGQLANLPAAPPPPGVVPNHVNPYSSGPALIAVGTILTALMLTFTTIRIYTKAKIVRKYSPDDVTCVLAAVGASMYFVIIVCAATVGKFGIHMWDLTAADLASEGFLVSGFFANWTTALVWPLVKITFFLFYIQLFRPLKWVRYCSYAGIAATSAFYTLIIAVTLGFTAPGPGQSFLDAASSPRQGLMEAWILPIAAVGLVIDVYILLLPLAAVSTLQLSTRRKFGVMAVFLTGFSACIASSLSVYYKWRLHVDTTDLTFETLPVLICCHVEMCVGIIASCMPALSNWVRQQSSWKAFGSKIVSRFTSKRSKPSGASYFNESKSNYASLDDNSKAHRQPTYELTPVKSIKTYIHGSHPNVVEEDGVHLQYDIEQTSHDRSFK